MSRGHAFEFARVRARGSRFWQTKFSLSERQSASYQGAFEAVLAVPIAIGIGYWCDSRFDSAPVGLLVGTVIGFAAMLLRVMRMRPANLDTETSDEPEPDAGTESTAPERDRESDR